ncbi:cytochrome P450 [Microbaculum marinum]|uniref:Cytochrome P450 n=1 Tax=Microbaculum marinum TaxID=1764581 RepID=A0AAW9RVI7_9HYPH
MSDLEADIRARFGLADIAQSGPPAGARPLADWRITRYADCQEALRHQSVTTIDMAQEMWVLQRSRSVDLPSLASFMSGVLIARTSPFHPKGREFLRILQKSAPASPEAIADHANTLLSGVATGEPCDMVPICNALPLVVVADYAGLDRDTISHLDHANRKIMIQWAAGPNTAPLPYLDQEAGKVTKCVLDAIAAARRAGAGRLHDAVELGSRRFELDDEEICGLLLFLIVAAVETSAGFLANLVLLMQRHPQFAEAAMQTKAPRNRLVEEAMRFLGPVRRGSRRRATAAVEIGGQQISAGSSLFIDFEAAHHDPLAFPDPWLFDPERKGPVTLGFGAGAHTCVGSRPGRQMAALFLDAMTAYRIEPADDGPPDWIPHPGFRMPGSLPSVLTPR